MKKFLKVKNFKDKLLVLLGIFLIVLTGGLLLLVGSLQSLGGGINNLLGEKPFFQSFNIRSLNVLNPESEKKLSLIDHQEGVPKVSAGGVWVEDLTVGKVLYSYHADARLLPASTTKMMTALVGIEYFRLEDDLVVTSEALVSGSTMGLSEGERLSFRAVLYGMLLNSGNDAAYTIATNYPGGLEGFE